MTALPTLAWRLAIHGPSSVARHPTHGWLADTPAGRAALRSVWLGLHVLAAGNLGLLAIRLRRAELTGGAR